MLMQSLSLWGKTSKISGKQQLKACLDDSMKKNEDFYQMFEISSVIRKKQETSSPGLLFIPLSY